MSIAPLDQESSEDKRVPAHDQAEGRASEDPKPVKRKRRSTSHLKAVPETLALREEMKAEAEKYVQRLDCSNPFTKAMLEDWSRELLAEMEQPEKFLGFMMVLIGNFFWKRQFLAIPFERRLLLLPHCLKHAEGCPAEYDEFGLDCEKCGACSIADYKVKAEKLGYKVLVAEGSPVVLKIIVGGYVDGILGVACLNVLEKSIDKVLIAGVPSYAVPLHSGDCKNTKMDEPWIWEVLEKYEPLEQPLTRSYLPTMRAANSLFEEHFDEILPPLRTKTEAAARTPLGKTEAIAYEWLKHGGKRFRPFITLAAYDALIKAQQGEGADNSQTYPLGVQKAAMAIEVFHKASLIHDDIEDDDQYRYGQETLHRQHGTGMAINIGDYLIGIGYRLLNEARADIGAEAAADLVEKMAAAHLKLCEGQGAEMAWQESETFELSPLDALQIYALKTSPAFEAALYAGVRMTGSAGEYEELISSFSRQIGVGFQILNDLKDWRGDDNNKLISGQDALAMRPTLLLALALQAGDEQQKAELKEILNGGGPSEYARINRLRKIYEACDVFTKAEVLVDKSRDRAEELAESVQNEDLKQLLKFFCETVLAEETPEVKPDLPVLMPQPIA